MDSNQGHLRDLYFVLPPGVVLLDFAGPWQVFRSANVLQPLFRLHVVGPQASVTITPDGRQLAPSTLALSGIAPLPESIADDAIVFVIGTHSSTARQFAGARAQVVAWLRQQFVSDVSAPVSDHAASNQRILMTACAGALLAAQAGLLKQRRCTTHHDLYTELLRFEPQAKLCENRIFVCDGPVYTSAGVTSALDLSLHVLGEWTGQAIAMAVARELVVYLRRSGDDPQLGPFLSWRNHLQGKVHRVQDLICQRPEQAWTLAELADAVHLSVRHLTRSFREATGISLHAYQQQIRLDHARRLLQDSGHSVERVAELSGYGSARSLRRAWLSQHGDTPSAQRRAGRR